MYAGSNWMTPTYDGTIFEAIVIAPDHSVYSDVFHTQITFHSEPNPGGGDIFYDVPPAKWGVGYATILFKINGQLVAWAKMPVGMDPLPTVGPLKDAVSNDLGGVQLFPEFQKAPTVAVANISLPVPVQGTNYIPPGALKAGRQTIVVRDNTTLECSTRDVEVKKSTFN
jgi:hypothetical protein